LIFDMNIVTAQETFMKPVFGLCALNFTKPKLIIQYGKNIFANLYTHIIKLISEVHMAMKQW